ncbi:uncharacterized protein LOC132174293 [Corylus avellana]|uniref:uncharacterized protein LOC132174293 n=1 Tax=Corylus avellana TaxID=13451 RepID=UPI00286C27E0|nr:uncharacterized protein LOC132174293 [Corylus avellana]
MCPMCRVEVETVGHALWSCSTTQDVWMEGNTKIQKSTSDEDAFSHIFLKLLNRLEDLDFDLVACTAWQIWLRQNILVFEGEFTHPKIVAQAAGNELAFHLQVSQRANGGRRKSCQQANEKWKAPPMGIVKLNWDAAID